MLFPTMHQEPCCRVPQATAWKKRLELWSGREKQELQKPCCRVPQTHSLGHSGEETTRGGDGLWKCLFEIPRLRRTRKDQCCVSSYERLHTSPEIVRQRDRLRTYTNMSNLMNQNQNRTEQNRNRTSLSKQSYRTWAMYRRETCTLYVKLTGWVMENLRTGKLQTWINMGLLVLEELDSHDERDILFYDLIM